MPPRSKLCLLALLVPWVLTCSDEQGEAVRFDSALVDEQDRPSVGHFENRGHKYNLHDLMDDQFRATHADPYVQEFDPDVSFDAGLSNTTYRFERDSYQRKMGSWSVRKSSRGTVGERTPQINNVHIMLEPLPGRPDQSPQSTEP